MKDKFKRAIRTILLEFKERDLPNLVYRDIHPPKLHSDVRKAWVLMGMRRVGKTWTAYQYIKKREKEGIPKEANLYVNFEDDRLSGFGVEDFQSVLDVYFELYPQMLDAKNLFFCFDEIHIVPGWEKFIRRLIDTEKMEICVTGSSAEMLSKELGTTLGGRAWPQEIFPFSFAEFLQFKKIVVSEPSHKTELMIKNWANEYLLYGGFPEAVAESKELHPALIQGYMDAVVMRDVVKRYLIGNADVLQKFLSRILRQLAAPLSVTKIYNTLKSLGVRVGKNSLFEYLQYFEEAYAILSVPYFSLSEKVRQVNPKKIYAIDQGVITAYSVKTDFEQASRLENAVFMHLRRSFKNICYYKTVRQKKEIDFVVTTERGELLLFQVCVTIDDEKTKERECSAIIEACEELGMDRGTIVTLDHEEVLISDGITITFIPYWKWALS